MSVHFEVLIEDASGKIALEFFLADILAALEPKPTFRIISYKGVGRIPRNLSRKSNPQHRILLDRLPQLLRGYGRTYAGRNDAIVVCIFDLDRNDEQQVRTQLDSLLRDCEPRPTTLWGIAIEEGEAWLLGDRDAVLAAYPEGDRSVLDSYKQDSICGTWELLADAVYKGGSKKLIELGFPHTGNAKCEFAKNIAPLVDTEHNASPSFQRLRTAVLDAATRR